MNYTHDELVHITHHGDNELAQSLLASFEDVIEEQREELDTVKAELVEYLVGKVEEEIDAHNRETCLAPTSDTTKNIVDCIRENISEEDVARAIADLHNSDLTDVALVHLESLSSDDRQLLASDIVEQEAYTVRISQGYKAVLYCLTSHALTEYEEDLDHYLEDMPLSMHEPVTERLTGKPLGLYYVDNSDCTVDLVLDLEWLAKWVMV